jgi:CubicO group peptidase (beta-lactamase class C family)
MMSILLWSLSVQLLHNGGWQAYGLKIAIQPAKQASSLPTQSNIELIAIDCGILHGPPNTLLAAKRALSNGADALNIDLILTKDLKLVGMHSPSHYLPYTDFQQPPTNLGNLTFDSLPKTPSCETFRKYLLSKGVSATHLNSLGDCEPQAMNTVEDFLEAFPNIPMHFDMKADTLALQFRQKQILEDILYSKFPERAKIMDGSFTSVRFFHKPEETIQFSKIHEQFSRNRPSLPVFLGDPTGDESFLELSGVAVHEKDTAYQSVLNLIERGPEHALPGVMGAYVSVSTINSFGTFEIPTEWQGKFVGICDMPDLIEQTSVKACAPFRRAHTHFFTGDPQMSLSKSFAPRIATWAYTLRGVHQEGEDLPTPTFTRCAGKMITAALVLLLQEKRMLPGLDEPIVGHLKLPKLKNWQSHPALRQLTLRQVMSGVGGFVSTHMDDVLLNAKYRSTEDISTEALAMIPETFQVGNTFIYSNVAWTVVERAIEQATGLPFPKVARKYLFDPIGISSKTFYMEKKGPACPFRYSLTRHLDGSWGMHSSGTQVPPEYPKKTEMVNAKAGIGLCTATDDWELLAQTVASGKSPKTNIQILSEESLHELYVDQLNTHFTESMPKASKAYPLGLLGRHFFERPNGDSNYDPQSTPLSLSRGLGHYMIAENGVLMAWGGLAANQLAPNRGKNSDLDATIMINPRSSTNGVPTYLSQLTWLDAREQNTNKHCAKVAYGRTHESAITSC